MKTKFSTWKKSLVITLAIVVSSIGSGYLAQSHMKNATGIGKLNEGAATCFSRISQAFVAYNIADTKGGYLQNGFQKTTEACLGDVNNLLEAATWATTGMLTQFNRVLNDAHWFHKSISKTVDRHQNFVSNSKEMASTIHERYQTVEGGMGAFTDQLATAATSATAQFEQWRNIALGGFAVSLLLMGWLVSVSLKTDRAIRGLESRARAMATEGMDQYTQIDKLINSTLLEAGFNDTAALFRNYNDHVLTKIMASSPDELEKAAEEVLVIEEPPTVNMNNIFDMCYEKISGRIFSSGLIVDMETDEDIYMEIDQEEATQLVHTILSCGINLADRSENKKIQFRTKTLGDILFVKATIQGQCFNTYELEYFNFGNSNVSNIDLNIIREIAKDMGAEATIKNDLSDNQMNAVIEISLAGIVEAPANVQEQLDPTADGSERKLRSVVKGSKKEIMRRIREAQV